MRSRTEGLVLDAKETQKGPCSRQITDFLVAMVAHSSSHRGANACPILTTRLRRAASADYPRRATRNTKSEYSDRMPSDVSNRAG
jgi:hypothetical protein